MNRESLYIYWQGEVHDELMMMMMGDHRSIWPDISRRSSCCCWPAKKKKGNHPLTVYTVDTKWGPVIIVIKLSQQQEQFCWNNQPETFKRIGQGVLLECCLMSYLIRKRIFISKKEKRRMILVVIRGPFKGGVHHPSCQTCCCSWPRCFLWEKYWRWPFKLIRGLRFLFIENNGQVLEMRNSFPSAFFIN